MTTSVAYQNLRNAAKAVSTQNFMAVELQSKQEDHQVNNLILDFKELEKEEQTKPRANKRKETIKIQAEINEIK